MRFAVLIFSVTVVAYALNTWKIRKIARHRLLATVALEGAQAAAFMLVLVRACAGPIGVTVTVPYVLGAMIGTAVAMWDTRRMSRRVSSDPEGVDEGEPDDAICRCEGGRRAGLRASGARRSPASSHRTRPTGRSVEAPLDTAPSRRARRAS